jgi:hypothetical protein
MDESQLNQDLKALSEQPIPNLPNNFNGSVWAKIRVAKAAAIRENWLDGLVSTLLRPRWATAAMAITLLVGGNLGRILASSENVPTQLEGIAQIDSQRAEGQVQYVLVGNSRILHVKHDDLA